MPGRLAGSPRTTEIPCASSAARSDGDCRPGPARRRAPGARRSRTRNGGHGCSAQGRRPARSPAHPTHAAPARGTSRRNETAFSPGESSSSRAADRSAVTQERHPGARRVRLRIITTTSWGSPCRTRCGSTHLLDGHFHGSRAPPRSPAASEISARPGSARCRRPARRCPGSRCRRVRSTIRAQQTARPAPGRTAGRWRCSSRPRRRHRPSGTGRRPGASPSSASRRNAPAIAVSPPDPGRARRVSMSEECPGALLRAHAAGLVQQKEHGRACQKNAQTTNPARASVRRSTDADAEDQESPTPARGELPSSPEEPPRENSQRRDGEKGKEPAGRDEPHEPALIAARSHASHSASTRARASPASTPQTGTGRTAGQAGRTCRGCGQDEPGSDVRFGIACQAHRELGPCPACLHAVETGPLSISEINRGPGYRDLDARAVRLHHRERLSIMG